MPARGRSDNLGERLIGIEARFEAFEKYEHDRWHKLNNDLQPLVTLPERVTREIGKLQGTFDGRINVVSKELERAITSAVEKGLSSVNDDITRIRKDVDDLCTFRDQHVAGQGTIKAILNNPLLMWVVMIAGIVWATITEKLK